MGQQGRVAGGVLDARAVQRQRAGRDGDAVGVALARQHRVPEAQRAGARARDIGGLHALRADLQRQRRAAAVQRHLHRLGEVDGGEHPVARLQLARRGRLGAGQGHRRHRGRGRVHAQRGVGRHGGVAQGRRVAGGVADRAAVEQQAVGADGQAVGVLVPRLHGVGEAELAGAGAAGVGRLHHGPAVGLQQQQRRAGDEHRLGEIHRDRDGVPGVQQAALPAAAAGEDHAALDDRGLRGVDDHRAVRHRREVARAVDHIGLVGARQQPGRADRHAQRALDGLGLVPQVLRLGADAQRVGRDGHGVAHQVDGAGLADAHDGLAVARQDAAADRLHRRHRGVDAVGRVVGALRVLQARVVAGKVTDRAALQHDAVGGDADATGIVLPRGHRQAEGQRGAAAAADILRRQALVAHVQHQHRHRAAGPGRHHHVGVEAHRGRDRVAGVQPAVDRARGAGQPDLVDADHGRHRVDRQLAAVQRPGRVADGAAREVGLQVAHLGLQRLGAIAGGAQRRHRHRHGRVALEQVARGQRLRQHQRRGPGLGGRDGERQRVGRARAGRDGHRDGQCRARLGEVALREVAVGQRQGRVGAGVRAAVAQLRRARQALGRVLVDEGRRQQRAPLGGRRQQLGVVGGAEAGVLEAVRALQQQVVQQALALRRGEAFLGDHALHQRAQRGLHALGQRVQARQLGQQAAVVLGLRDTVALGVSRVGRAVDADDRHHLAEDVGQPEQALDVADGLLDLGRRRHLGAAGRQPGAGQRQPHGQLGDGRDADVHRLARLQENEGAQAVLSVQADGAARDLVDIVDGAVVPAADAHHHPTAQLGRQFGRQAEAVRARRGADLADAQLPQGVEDLGAHRHRERPGKRLELQQRLRHGRQLRAGRGSRAHVRQARQADQAGNLRQRRLQPHRHPGRQEAALAFVLGRRRRHRLGAGRGCVGHGRAGLAARLRHAPEVFGDAEDGAGVGHGQQRLTVDLTVGEADLEPGLGRRAHGAVAHQQHDAGLQHQHQVGVDDGHARHVGARDVHAQPLQARRPRRRGWRRGTGLRGQRARAGNGAHSGLRCGGSGFLR